MKIDASQCKYEMYKSMNYIPVQAVCGNYTPPKEILVGGEVWVLKKEYTIFAHYERKEDD